jgi:hypothetical protein
MRQLGHTDLRQPRAAQETYFPLPFLFLIHYPESWTLPLFLLAAILLISLIIVAIRRRIIRWQGFLLALAVILAAMAAAAVLISLLTPAFPRLFKWNVELWPDWPEVIPPNGLAAFAGLAILTTALGVFGYRLTRRISSPADFTLAVLMLMFMMSAAATFASPPAAYAFIWPVLIGSLAWLMILLIRPLRAWPHEISATLTALPLIVLLLPFIPGIVMADGTKSLAILGAVLIPILFSVLAAIDQLVYQPTMVELSGNPSITRSSGKRSRP